MTRTDPATTPPATAARQTAVLASTSILTHGFRGAAESPPPIALCSHCWAVDDRLDAPGWVITKPVAGFDPAYRFGVCPACLTSVYEFPAEG